MGLGLFEQSLSHSDAPGASDQTPGWKPFPAEVKGLPWLSEHVLRRHPAVGKRQRQRCFDLGAPAHRVLGTGHTEPGRVLVHEEAGWPFAVVADGGEDDSKVV